MGIFNLFSHKDTKAEVIANNHIDTENGAIKLIILTESKNKYLQNFFVSQGIYPEEVCYNIDDVSRILIREKSSIRLVIIDQGLGDLYNVSTRDELQNLFGMCDGVYKKILAFYSKRSFYFDNKSYGSDIVRWEVYDSLAQVTDVINSLDEEYSVTKEFASKFINDLTAPMQTKGKLVGNSVKSTLAQSDKDMYEIMECMYAECIAGDGESLPTW